MSTRIIATFTAGASALLLVAGCATGEDGQEHEDSPAEEQPVVHVETDTVKTDSTGYSCSCPAGQEMQAGLCYPTCAAGYTGEGPVCWQVCASGFTDTGFFCQRDSKIIKANTSSCPWYNKCGLGSSCSKCPAGYANDGCTCRIDAYIYAQPSYGRGAGTTPSCSSY